MSVRVLVTGGAGFIGSALIRHLIRNSSVEVLNLDKLTYAGNLTSLAEVEGELSYRFLRADVCDRLTVSRAFHEFQPDFVVHLAAESHVDRSIAGASDFIQTNIVGTYVMLESAKDYWLLLPPDAQKKFRFLHVSTDEVFGSLGEHGLFSEATPYDPSSPYSASKASSDHLVMAWHRTYGLPCIISNCSNNYGPYHFPEKLIPLTILNALEEKPLPIYGNGMNVRDWLYVEDHARALLQLLHHGRPGEKYNIGARSERRNIDVVKAVCEILDTIKPARKPRVELIEYVTDRPGHDLRYAIDPTKIETEVGWSARESFESGLQKTIAWYLDNRQWWEKLERALHPRKTATKAEQDT